MAASLDTIMAVMQNGVQAIRDLVTVVGQVFPNTTASSSSAPSAAGSITYNSSQAAGFMLVTTSSGFSAKVPFYNQ
jgi:hypothetical protein